MKKTDIKKENNNSDSIFKPDIVNKKLSEMICSFGLPEWTFVDENNNPCRCCECDQILGEESIRNISVCLNAQYFGDIQLEILCKSCCSSYFIHFRQSCKKMNDFCISLLGEKPKGIVQLQHEIKLAENNLTSKIIDDIIKRKCGD